jgi:hypothetical protein
MQAEAVINSSGGFRTLTGRAVHIADRRIGTDLSVMGLSPPLHLPVAAGLAQGTRLPEPELPRRPERQG